MVSTKQSILLVTVLGGSGELRSPDRIPSIVGAADSKSFIGVSSWIQSFGGA